MNSCTLDQYNNPKKVNAGEYSKLIGKKVERTIVYPNLLYKLFGWFHNCKILVSTVFLGIDHNFSDKGSPILFETCLFDNGLSEVVDRYETWEKARIGHNKWVDSINKHK